MAKQLYSIQDLRAEYPGVPVYAIRRLIDKYDLRQPRLNPRSHRMVHADNLPRLRELLEADGWLKAVPVGA